jgi:Tol biopolymer transport system component
VDGKGDLWVAHADGRDAERMLRGNYTLPAWSEDGRTLAIAERKDSGRRWEISVVHLPEKYRRQP